MTIVRNYHKTRGSGYALAGFLCLFATILLVPAGGMAAGADRAGHGEKVQTAGRDANAASKRVAAEPRVLLELFTSQGCSSCPKADALLPVFIARKDVIAISLAIKYWDYLGWADTFGKEVFTARQKSYGRKIGDGIIYTPQIIVDGIYHANGADEKAIRALIDRRKKDRAGRPAVALDIRTRDDMLLVSVGAAPDGQPVAKATLWLALFSRKKKVRVRRGENRGRFLAYHNIVRELTPIGRWTGEKLVLSLPRKQIMQRGADGCVVFLQKGDGGPIIAAAQMSRW